MLSTPIFAAKYPLVVDYRNIRRIDFFKARFRSFSHVILRCEVRNPNHFQFIDLIGKDVKHLDVWQSKNLTEAFGRKFPNLETMNVHFRSFIRRIEIPQQLKVLNLTGIMAEARPSEAKEFLKNISSYKSLEVFLQDITLRSTHFREHLREIYAPEAYPYENFVACDAELQELLDSGNANDMRIYLHNVDLQKKQNVCLTDVRRLGIAFSPQQLVDYLPKLPNLVSLTVHTKVGHIFLEHEAPVFNTKIRHVKVYSPVDICSMCLASLKKNFPNVTTWEPPRFFQKK